MKTQAEILRWLKANLGKVTGGLTSQDAALLVASVNLSNCISYQSAPEGLFEAYRNIVEHMQPTMRWLAFHAIAMELDWSHRAMIWQRSGLSQDDIIGRPKCAFEPGGSLRVGGAS